MNISRFSRRGMAVAGGSILIALSAAACGSGGQGPSTTTSTTPTTTTTTTTTPQPSSSPAPTEKSLSPTGGNLFSPGVTAPGAPTVQPGTHPGLNGTP
ncbi:hypothetical protein FZI85_22125 [Mycobacterium sp. CBMA293]|nr:MULTISPECIES: hypothetical protein [unclassified Mycolicibacterium]MUL60715.1 hypothetical protein [Mycolicibacterium sp. CBMA 335]MUL72530.1 hypothetical protein [Mycolicibacterium sp. CBMA 311]MUM07113.1 hypothetical protein [Mycolicibacterium sp. CBMA 213]MUM13710.1 hypothetical protein [Mycolicibacterium sp. CBMA 293]MUL46043.1 hypothetical protein [Mycolicibacterium sp. CBMA 360]